jgi:DNA-directed DNA polymerase III PolC
MAANKPAAAWPQRAVPHLHVHSNYSFLRGLASPHALAQKAAEFGLPALALTDYGILTGAIEFHEACQQAGIQAIHGLEVSVMPPPALWGEPGSLVLLATSLPGWRNLCRLSSAMQDEDVIAFDQLTQILSRCSEPAGLICLSGGQLGLATRLVKQGETKTAAAWLGSLKDCFKDHLYLEIQSHTPQDPLANHHLEAIGKQLKIPLAATHHVHYLQPEQAGLQRLATAIRLNTPLNDLPAERAAPNQAHFISPDDMQRQFAAHPAALDAAHEIAGRCQFVLPLDQPQFPQLALEGNQSAFEVLKQKAFQGAIQRYGRITPEIQARLEHELATIGGLGYAVLFLVMEEILNFARSQGIPTASRGSASSSLVAHCLGITSPDPVRLNLYFERFLNPARARPPDIDTDLCSQRRDEVIEFVYDRFGRDQVAMVATINRFRRRSALREVAKAYGLPVSQISALVNELPNRWYGPRSPQEKQAPYAELAERRPGAIYQAIFRDAAALIGQPHHLSIHPGGIVIAPCPIHDLLPTLTAPKGVKITQFDLDSVERLGLVKIDLLGIRGLSVLGETAQAIQRQTGRDATRGKEKHRAALDFLESIPEDDLATTEMVQHGRTIGCFQIESPGMRATLREIQARSVDDIMAALALYRPGPLTGGLKDAFVRRFKGLEPIQHLHPALAPLLQDTYGVILYQEQVLRIAHELAGLSLADADLLRRAMSHFDPGKQMQTLKERFIAGAALRNNVPEAIAERVWEMMAAFAGYGFPKAHAASYAQIGWRAAWCKTHHPALFMAAVLANWGGYYSQRVYLTEARRLGLALNAPHVNHAQREFSVKYLEGQPALFMGLDQVRDLTRRTQARILSERPFSSLSDFLGRVDPRPREAENLARCGALEGFGSIPALLEALQHETWRSQQLPLFPMEISQAEDWSIAQKVAAQEEILGASIAAHPLELFAAQIAASQALTTQEAASHLGQRVTVAGMRQTWRRSLDRNGQTIYFMTLEDLEGMLQVVIPAQVYRRARSVLKGPGPYWIQGFVDRDLRDGEAILRAEDIQAVE